MTKWLVGFDGTEYQVEASDEAEARYEGCVAWYEHWLDDDLTGESDRVIAACCYDYRDAARYALEHELAGLSCEITSVKRL